MLYFYRISINDFYIIKQLTLSYKISKFLQKFCLVFCYCLLPDESILIGTGFNFCTINKNGLSGNFSHIKQCIRHFCKDTFRTGSKMDTSKPCKCCMIRSWVTFQKKHKIDISFTIQFHGTRGVIPVHVRIEHNLQKCSGRHRIYSFISRIQVSQIHSLHKLTQ